MAMQLRLSPEFNNATANPLFTLTDSANLCIPQTQGLAPVQFIDSLVNGSFAKFLRDDFQSPSTTPVGEFLDCCINKIFKVERQVVTDSHFNSNYRLAIDRLATIIHLVKQHGVKNLSQIRLLGNAYVVSQTQGFSDEVIPKEEVSYQFKEDIEVAAQFIKSLNLVVMDRPEPQKFYQLADLIRKIGNIYAIIMSPECEGFFLHFAANLKIPLKQLFDNEFKAKFYQTIAFNLETLNTLDSPLKLLCAHSSEEVEKANNLLLNLIPSLKANLEALYENRRIGGAFLDRRVCLITAEWIGKIESDQETLANCKVQTYSTYEEKEQRMSEMIDVIVNYWMRFLEIKDSVASDSSCLSIIEKRYMEQPLPPLDKVILFKSKLKELIRSKFTAMQNSDESEVIIKTDGGPTGLLGEVTAALDMREFNILFPLYSITYISSKAVYLNGNIPMCLKLN